MYVLLTRVATGAANDRLRHIAPRIVTEYNLWIGGCEFLSILMRYAARLVVLTRNDMSSYFVNLTLFVYQTNLTMLASVKLFAAIFCVLF